MPRKKSEAAIYSARLNPINPEEKQVIEIIKKYEQPGLHFKDMVVQAFLERDGFDPYLFAREPQQRSINPEELEGILRAFGDDLLKSIKDLPMAMHTGGAGAGNEPDENAKEISANMARGFMQRRKGN